MYIICFYINSLEFLNCNQVFYEERVAKRWAVEYIEVTFGHLPVELGFFL